MGLSICDCIIEQSVEKVQVRIIFRQTTEVHVVHAELQTTSLFTGDKSLPSGCGKSRNWQQLKRLRPALYSVELASQKTWLRLAECIGFGSRR